MKILDLDMDYFMRRVAYMVPESVTERLPEEGYASFVWSKKKVRSFLENNLGLSKSKKIKGRIVSGHNEALEFWRELIAKQKLTIPFEVVHVDSHADLGLGYNTREYISNTLLSYPVAERPLHGQYKDAYDRVCKEAIGDYLLFAIAYRWISHLTYCANPRGDANDYFEGILKDFQKKHIGKKPASNTIQLSHNPNMNFPRWPHFVSAKQEYLITSCKEPEVPFWVIPTVENVKFNGDFDFAVMAQSPNYTPASADFIMDIFREYIIEE